VACRYLTRQLLFLALVQTVKSVDNEQR